MSLSVYHTSLNLFACKILDVREGQNYQWKLLFLYGSPYLDFRQDV